MPRSVFPNPSDDLLVPPPNPGSVSVSFKSPDVPTPSTGAAQNAPPSTATLAAIPISPSPASAHNTDPDNIPRPQNPLTSTIEHSNHSITSILSQGWNNLSETEKQAWQDKDAAEEGHYPENRFGPNRQDNGYINFILCAEDVNDIGTRGMRRSRN